MFCVLLLILVKIGSNKSRSINFEYGKYNFMVVICKVGW